MTTPTIATDNGKTKNGAPGAPADFNIASYLPRVAHQAPDRPAVVIARRNGGEGQANRGSMTFAELETLSNRCANGLAAAGIGRGTRVLVMVKPGFEFMGLTFALFKMGAIPVMIDPGMGVGRMLECLRGVDLDAFIGVPLAHARAQTASLPSRSPSGHGGAAVVLGWSDAEPTRSSIPRRVPDRGHRT